MDRVQTLLLSLCFSQRKQQTNCWPIIHSAPPSFSYWKGHQFGDQRLNTRHFQFFIRFLKVLRIIYFISRKSILSALLFSFLVALHFCSLHNFFFKSIYCMFFLARSHFPFFIISSLWSSVSFFFFSVMAALPVVLLWGPEFPLANETRAAYLPCFCNPAVSFLKYKLIFIQWSSCAGSDPLRGDCILWQQVGGKK